ncbi:MAG TPA: hypothetical protein ENK21_03980 [Trueperaceae bacterium]|nr:hypothetical protein [Trueperaceae bacterium]
MFKKKFNLMLVVALFTLVFSACSQQANPKQQDNKTYELVKLDPQAPTLTLDFSSTDKRLHELAPLEQGSSLSSLAAPTGKLEMKILIISAVDDDSDLNAAKSMLDEIGIPYDVLIAKDQNLTTTKLAKTNGDGNYYGIILAEGGLQYESNGTYPSALSNAEWSLLHQYERDYKVRQLTMYTNGVVWANGSLIEDYGLRVKAPYPNDHVDTTNQAYNVKFTSAGKNVFSNLKPNVTIPIRYAYTYLTKLDSSGGITATPLIKDNAGNILAASSTTADGRERLALTFANNPYVIHAKVLSLDLVRWLTKGVYLGDKQFYFGLDQDDWFLPSESWDANVGGINGEYRLNAHDAKNTAKQVEIIKNRYSFVRNSHYPFRYTMAFNASGSDPRAPKSCNENVSSVDPLSSMTKCIKDSFYWVNHTWSHEYMDWTNFWESYKQIYWNQYAAYYWFGFNSNNRMDFSTLVTGDISGLGWFNPAGPDDPGPKQDLGLNRSNRRFLRAAKYRGIRYVAGNMSVKSLEPDCKGCGIYHPLEKSILIVPRWPTNVFYSVNTPWDAMDAYNRIYGPNGSKPFFDHDLSYQEFLDFEANIAFGHLLSGQQYSHYQHVGNLRDYGNGRSLAYDWTRAVLDKYEKFYDLPIISLSWRNVARRTAYRTSFMKSGVRAILDSNNNTITVTTNRPAWVYMSGIRRTGNSWVYGNVPISRFVVSGSKTISYNLMDLNSQSLSTQGYETFDEDLGVSSLSLSGDYEFEEDYSQQVVPELENR